MKYITISMNMNYNDYNKYIYKDKGENCFSNRSPFDRYRGILFYLLRICYSIKLNKFMPVHLGKVWNFLILDANSKECAAQSDAVCFIFDGSAYRLVQSGFHRYLRRKYGHCKLVFDLDGKVDIFFREYPSFSVERLKRDFDLVLSYNPYDVEHYNLLQARMRLVDYNILKFEGKYKKTDAFFVGAAKDRLDKIIHVYEQLSNAGLVCDFHITDVPQEKQKYTDKI